MSPRSAALSERMKRASTAAILEAAEQVFAEEGFQAATTARIAARAGVSKGLVFNYFPTKEDLLAEIVRRRLSEQLAFWRTLRLDGPPESQLREIVDRGLDAVVRHPHAHRLYLLLLVQPGASKVVSDAVESIKPALAEYYAMLERLFKALGSRNPKLQTILFQTALAGVAQVLTLQPDLAHKPALLPLDQIKEHLVLAAVRGARGTARSSRTRKANR